MVVLDEWSSYRGDCWKSCDCIYVLRTKFVAFEKEKNLSKVKCKNPLLGSIEKSQSNGHYMGWLTH